jgi:hypothetical protein
VQPCSDHMQGQIFIPDDLKRIGTVDCAPDCATGAARPHGPCSLPHETSSWRGSRFVVIILFQFFILSFSGKAQALFVVAVGSTDFSHRLIAARNTCTPSLYCTCQPLVHWNNQYDSTRTAHEIQLRNGIS